MIRVDKQMMLTGLQNGLVTTYELAKVVLPTAIILAFFRSSGLLDILVDFFSPLMKYVGLPGDAAIALFSGYFINLYAAVGSMIVLEITGKEAIIIAVMLVFSHSLLVELAISKKVGSPILFVLPLRIGLSIIVGALLGVVL